MSEPKRYGRLALRAGGFVLLCIAIVWLIDLGEVSDTLGRMRASAIVWVVLLSIVSYSVGIWKWKLLLRSVEARLLAKYYFIGLLYSLVLPGQLAGEAVKTVRLASSGPGLGRVSASVLLDRLTGMIGLGIVSGAGLLLSRTQNSMLTVMGVVIFTTTVAFAVVLFGIRVRWILRSALRLSVALSTRTGVLRKLGKAARRFLSAWRAHARDVGLMVRSVALGVVFQLLNVAIVWVIAWGMDIPLTFADAAWSQGIVMVVTLVPISFGGLGVREFSFVAVLALIGLPSAQAFSISVGCSIVGLFGALIGLPAEAGWFHRAQVSRPARERASHA
jgi:uncharacterized protein (TIRG00374 family)